MPTVFDYLTCLTRGSLWPGGKKVFTMLKGHFNPWLDACSVHKWVLTVAVEDFNVGFHLLNDSCIVCVALQTGGGEEGRKVWEKGSEMGWKRN